MPPPILYRAGYSRGDGASVSSIGSSCSPPPGSEELSDISSEQMAQQQEAVSHERPPSPMPGEQCILGN